MAAPSPSRALGRGLLRRCPRCGGRGLFSGWWTMRDRCPTCGLHFERDEGFFLGAWVMNYAIASGVVAVVLTVVIAVLASDPHANLVPIIAVGGVAAVVVPIVFYPWSRTIWVAIELIMRPLDPREVADADQAQAEFLDQPDSTGFENEDH
jgi:hypothetical protein